ncbi:hypothetical protein RL72_00655 [Microbacterium azadirachtae]|uniref:Uncharacterized protein n=1 Tax=Microbacterium azadirachtae TaxID=582680 RepID=A0A0F0L230_9MICO|nr:hypothetical protein [Microbacterium azadirachtae]KJL27187.1 hypothetical protein RL72_00655 [Microbacterium azadirachtae]
MIVAGFLLLAVGLADVLRGFLRGRAFWIGAGIAAAVLLALSVLGDAAPFALLGIALAALWTWLLPLEGRPRLSFWPAVLLALIAVGGVALLPARTSAGLLSGAPLPTPIGRVGFDLAVLAVGVFAVLLETGNVIVRAALLGEKAELPADVEPGQAPPAEAVHGLVPARALDPGVPTAPTPSLHASAPDSGFRGGRLIGPLERVIVLLLTLFAAYPLLAAMLAAKGIVRFPEISRDGAHGGRAEYFLVGSLVSWVVALGGALLLWWATHTG